MYTKMYQNSPLIHKVLKTLTDNAMSLSMRSLVDFFQKDTDTSWYIITSESYQNNH